MIITNSCEGLAYIYAKREKNSIYINNLHYHNNEFIKYCLAHKDASHLFAEKKPFKNQIMANLASKEELASYYFFLISMELGLKVFRLIECQKYSDEATWIGLSPNVSDNFMKTIYKLDLHNVDSDQYGIWESDGFCASLSEHGSYFEGVQCKHYQVKTGFSNLSGIDFSTIDIVESWVQIKQKKSACGIRPNVISNRDAESMLLL